MDQNLLMPVTPAIQHLCVRALFYKGICYFTRNYHFDHLQGWWFFAFQNETKRICAVMVSLGSIYHVHGVGLKHDESFWPLLKNKHPYYTDIRVYIDIYFFVNCLINIWYFICAERETYYC